MTRHAKRRAKLLRPSGFDELGLRTALSDRMLPFLVAAMTFLAAMALAGAIGASSLAGHWRSGAGGALTVQVPKPGQPAETHDGTRLERVLSLLRGTPGIASARALTEDELGELLRPWLGAGIERVPLSLPAVIAVHQNESGADLETMTRRLISAAPGTLVESHGTWLRRLSLLARSLQACAALALVVVAMVAAAVVAIATRAGLFARREAIEIVHALGATDGYIAGRFAGRAAGLAALGGMAGTVAAAPLLLALANLAAPFVTPSPAQPDDVFGLLQTVPLAIWVALPALPLATAAIGFLTAQGTVRRWLRRLP